ncbi:ras guanine nucleotide exchange factor domain-containing protein [Dipodascopsis uninucleata]
MSQTDEYAIHQQNVRGNRRFGFHPLLRSLSDFCPKSLPDYDTAAKNDEVIVFLQFSADDIFLVFQVDESGWVKSVLLSSGEEGWIPANYCESYDRIELRPLVVAALNAEANTKSDQEKSYQIVMTNIVSGVKALLGSTQSLSKNSKYLQESANVKHSRRALLSEVVSLVSCVKYRQITENDSKDSIRIMKSTYSILNVAIKFLEEWRKEFGRTSVDEDSTYQPENVTFAGGNVVGMHIVPLLSCQSKSAQARLNGFYDSFLLAIGSYVDSDSLDLRSPASILMTTKHAVQAGKEFLAIVKSIESKMPTFDFSLSNSKESLYKQISVLVTTARNFVASQKSSTNEIGIEDLDDSHSDAVSTIVESKKLIDCSVACVQAAGVCLAKAKFALDQIGDFTMDINDPYEIDYDSSDMSSRRSSEPSELTSDRSMEGQIGMSSSEGLMSQLEPPHVQDQELEDPRISSRGDKAPLEDRILFNSDGQVQGGSLEALIKYFTSSDAAPDALFVSTFYLTFRLFTTPSAVAQALVNRYSSLSPDESSVFPIRLRVYNVFKGWMESYWRKETDNEALPIILDFANTSVKSTLPFASQRLLELSKTVVDSNEPIVPRLMSKAGEDTSIATLLPNSVSVPTPITNRIHIALLSKYIRDEGSAPSLLEFDPLELARQFTIKESRLFCQIVPEELLGQEFSKKSSQCRAVNVRAMSALSTDIANFVGETVLAGDVPLKVRTNILRHWIRVSEKCFELKNFNCLMAIICALQSSVILRLKKTWELLPPRYHALFSELKGIIVYEKNYSSYRKLLRNQSPPCIPYLGVYLTDLTFADEGNSDYRIFHIDEDDVVPVINFDKYVRTTKIITDLQRFQVPYRFQEVPEFQAWIDKELRRVHQLCANDQHILYKRSCIIEPKLGVTKSAATFVETSNSNSWNEETSDKQN